METREINQVPSSSAHMAQGCDRICRVQAVVINMINRIIDKFNEDIGCMNAANDYLSFRELAYDVFVELFRVLPEQLSAFGGKITFHIPAPPSRKNHPAAHIASLLIRGYYEAGRGDEQIRETIRLTQWAMEQDDVDILPIILSELVDKTSREATIWYIKASPSWHPSLNAVIKVVEQQLKRFYGILCENHLSDIAHIDQLTGLRNRRSLDKDFRWLLRAGDSFSVGIIDIDHFKNVNDTYGHGAGDEVLRFLWKSLSDFFLKVPHAAVGRFGGEEFLVIIPWEDKSQLETRLSEFQTYVAREYIAWKKEENYPAVITISWGTSDTSDIMQGELTVNDKQGELLQKADAALYWAKNSGRDKIFSWDKEKYCGLLAEKKAYVNMEGNNRILRDN